MSKALVVQATTLSDEQIDRFLDATADSFVRQLRSPILHAPSEQDLDYEEVTFPAIDGVPLEGWFIPAEGSQKLIIANHPMGFSRSGIPAHLESWRSIWSASGNAFEVNFIMTRRLALSGMPADRIPDLEQRLVWRTSIGFGPRAPQEWAKNVCVPTFLFQVHDDVLTDPSDVQTMFDNIPVAEKKVHWIRATSARWDGYLEFQRAKSQKCQ